MDDFSPSDLKAILHSKRANLYYLEQLKHPHPHRQHHHGVARHRHLDHPGRDARAGKAGVLVGFCGGGGTPLFSANEVDVEVAWLTPQGEYRPTEYRVGAQRGPHLCQHALGSFTAV